MKNTTKILALLLIAVMTLFAFASCKGSANGTMTLVISGEEVAEYEVSLDKVNGDKVIDVLNYLKAEENMPFEISGTMVTKVGELENDAIKNRWIYFWTSVEADADVTEWASYVEYDGKTLTSSGRSVIEMTVSDGAVIYIGYYQ